MFLFCSILKTIENMCNFWGERGGGEVCEVKFTDNIDNKYPAMFPCAQMLLCETLIACVLVFFSFTFARSVWGYKDKILSLPKSVVKNNHFIRFRTLG